MASLGKKKYVMFLVGPGQRLKHHSTGEHMAALVGKRKLSSPLALPLLAGMVPEHYDIRIIDEETTPFPSLRPDIVGLTSMIGSAERAYELADRFRAQGAKVVMGGPHASSMVELSLEHCDAVVVGEAEESWPRLLADFEAGKLQKVYRASQVSDYRTGVRPRWDLVPARTLMNINTQTSRGCPFACEFCQVAFLFGRKMRYREMDDVERELKSLPGKRIFYSDDNLTIDRKRARELVATVAPLGLSWLCQTGIDVAGDPELLRLMAEAGCHEILIGFETVTDESLVQIGKPQKAGQYSEAVAAIHKAGIHVMASLLAGLDFDGPEVFDKVFRFIQDNNILYGSYCLLTPLPGTQLYDRLVQEKRLVPGLTWDFYNGAFPSCYHPTMTLEQLMDGYMNLLERLFDIDSVKERALRLYETGWFATATYRGVTPKEIVTGFLYVLRRWAFSADTRRRSFFFELRKLVNARKLDMDHLIVLLYATEANLNYLAWYRKTAAELRPMYREFDRRRAQVMPGPAQPRPATPCKAGTPDPTGG